MSDKVINLTEIDFDQTINSGKVTLVDFWATWCGPCRMLIPIIDELANEIGDTVNICKVDIDRSPELASRYKIMSVPTMIIFKNGEVKEKIVGLRQKSQLIETINKY